MISSSPGTRLSRVAARFGSPADVLLGARILLWACALPILKRILPIHPLVRLVWRTPRLEPDAARDERVIVFARWACRLTRWKSGGNCLERGLIVYRFLLEGRAAPTLVVGMGRGGDADITGHAWVVLNGQPAGESAQSVSQYVPVFAFGPDGGLIRESIPSVLSVSSPTAHRS